MYPGNSQPQINPYPDITVPPGQKYPSDCAQKCCSFVRAALHPRPAAICAAVRGCATAPPSLPLCPSVSRTSIWWRGVLQVAYWKVKRRVVQWLRCVKCLFPPSLSLLQPHWSCERNGTHAQVVGGERKRDRGKKRERAVLSVFASPLRFLLPSPRSRPACSLLTPPSKRNRLPLPITTLTSAASFCIAGMSTSSGMLTDRIPFSWLVML